MVKRIINNQIFLKKISNAKPFSRKKLIKSAKPDEVKCLCESALNVLNKNVPINPSLCKKIKKHKEVFINLTSRKTSLRKKKRLLQKGGAFSLLPAIAKAVLGFVLPSLLRR
jgi:hypothetical protein